MKTVDFCQPGETEIRSAGVPAACEPQRPVVLPNSRPAEARLPSSGEAKPASFDSASLNEAVRLAQQGDAAAFESIYRLLAGRVYALCLRMMRDPAEAEDMTQEVFLQVFRELNMFRGESAFSMRLHRVAVNSVLMRLRKKSPATVSVETGGGDGDELDPPMIDVGAPDLHLEAAIDRVGLERCIEHLPGGYRAVFVLHDIEGYQHNEIAEMVGRSVGSSKSQLHKARTRLRELLQEAKREKASKERLASRMPRSQVRTGRPALAAAGAGC